MSSSLIHVLCVYIGITHAPAKLLSSDSRIYDDWSVYSSNSDGGWVNGDIVLHSNTFPNEKYHGLFGGNSNSNTSINSNQRAYISQLSRNDIQLSKYGTLTVTFTLIFGCDILNLTDIVTVTVGDTENIYYWLDAYDYGYATNNYPFNTQTFTINVFDSDPILYDKCDQIPGDTTVWTIDGIVTSKPHQANTAIAISFASKFDYSSPYEDDDKYWAVTNIQFKMDAIYNVSDTAKKDEIIGMDILIFIIILVVVGCVLIVIILILIIYCTKKKTKTDHDNINANVEMTDDGITVDWKYTVKGQKITDKTQLKSAFDWNSYKTKQHKPAASPAHIVPTNNYNNYKQQHLQHQHQRTISNNINVHNVNVPIVNVPPSLPTIMGKRNALNIKIDDDSDEDSLLRMQNEYADEEEY